MLRPPAGLCLYEVWHFHISGVLVNPPGLNIISAFLPSMLSAVEYCQHLLRRQVRPGDLAVDATAGNGHDTHFLTQLTSPGGRVFSFDVQPQAIAATKLLLQKNGVPESCYRLLPVCHTAMEEQLPEESKGRIAAVIFNLGYLPGGNKSIVTRTDTTLAAVRTALTVLRPGGLLLLVLYPGHTEGAVEAQALHQFAAGLPPGQWQVTEYRTLNARKAPPAVLAIEKSGAQGPRDADA